MPCGKVAKKRKQVCNVGCVMLLRTDGRAVELRKSELS